MDSSNKASTALKLLLVEDDEALREIYSTRLAAEGFSIFFAKDGEEALANAVKILPDIVVSDVMMPKISGFDMLDILLQTPETANVKVIMMTALGSEADIERGRKLGADKYLVKSQVTLEDLVQAVHEIARTINTNNQPQVAAAAQAQPAAPVVADNASKDIIDSQIAGLEATPAAQPAIPSQPAATKVPVTTAETTTATPAAQPAATPPEPTASNEVNISHDTSV